MKPKQIDAIMACDPRGVIGKDGKIPWNCPEDVLHFHNMTSNQIVVMGYTTWTSTGLPEGFFENRIGIVFTRKPAPSTDIPNIIFVQSLSDFLSLKLPERRKIFMIGGAELCQLFLDHNLIHDFILTEMNQLVDGDTKISLSLLKKWPSHIIRQTELFTIRCYANPKRQKCN